MSIFYLYLDESGEFNDNALTRENNPSLVGGLLHGEGVKVDTLLRDVPSFVHASEAYDKENLSLLGRAKDMGCRFVVFENCERISVINGDITYLNVLSEGIIKLLTNLAEENSEDHIELKILIASRLKVSSNSQKESNGVLETIPAQDYNSRLEEKLIIAMGKSKIENVGYCIDFASARKSKRLMLADIICNTYITRKAKKKFTDAERAVICDLFSDALIYSVFDSATVGYIRKLYIEKHYGEMLCQICSLPKLTGVTSLRNKVIERIFELPIREMNTVLNHVSLQISEYNYARMFAEGIHFADNYKKYILNQLHEYAEKNINGYGLENIIKIVNYWTFDTDFYILTMYDHIGNTGKCSEYLAKCSENLGAINSSWDGRVC